MAPGGHTSPGTSGAGRTHPVLRVFAGLTLTLDWSGRIITAVCLSVMFFALLANVILRYAFGSGIAWAYEIHALLLPWLVASGIVIAAARGRHIAITLLPDLLGGTGKRIILVLIQVSIIVISVSVLWSSQPILKASTFQTLSTLGITQIWGYSSLIYAFGGMAILAALDLGRVFMGIDVSNQDIAHSSLS